MRLWIMEGGLGGWGPCIRLAQNAHLSKGSSGTVRNLSLAVLRRGEDLGWRLGRPGRLGPCTLCPQNAHNAKGPSGTV